MLEKFENEFQVWREDLPFLIGRTIQLIKMRSEDVNKRRYDILEGMTFKILDENFACKTANGKRVTFLFGAKIKIIKT